jgi:hypothetical protein
VATIHAGLEMSATIRREWSAIPLVAKLILLAWLACRLAGCPVRVLHIALLHGSHAALGLATVRRATRFTFLEMLAMICFDAGTHTRMHWATGINNGLDTLQEEVLGRDKCDG